MKKYDLVTFTKVDNKLYPDKQFVGTFFISQFIREQAEKDEDILWGQWKNKCK